MSKVRTTITIDEGLRFRYQQVADLEGRSFSYIVNEWLSNVVQSAEFVALQVNGNKEASTGRLRALQSTIETVHEQSQEAMQMAGRTDTPQAGAKSPAAAGPVDPPRHVIRGGNSPQHREKTPRVKS